MYFVSYLIVQCLEKTRHISSQVSNYGYFAILFQFLDVRQCWLPRLVYIRLCVSFSGVRSVLAVCQVSGGNNNIVLEIDFLLAMMLRVKHGSQSTYLFISYLVHT